VCGANLLNFQQRSPKTLSNNPVNGLNTKGLLELKLFHRRCPLINCSEPSNGSKEESELIRFLGYHI
jgi:hypothetical protein